MKLYKTCNGCKAKRYSQTGYGGCWLNFETHPTKTLYGVIVDNAPSEACPKPKTNDLYIYLSKRNEKV